ncbi:MAG: flippase-like domain-containing protein [Chloroflexi bacterium]|nr:flippase-like domain-containing protein [Chloroflexota bacterium]
MAIPAPASSALRNKYGRQAAATHQPTLQKFGLALGECAVNGRSPHHWPLVCGAAPHLGGTGRLLTTAKPFYIFLALLAVTLTLLLKSWRWQLLLTDASGSPPFKPIFWSFNLGAYVNLVLPFMRLGEIARLFAINWTAQVGKARALGTIVVEKALDLFMLGLALLLVLPFVTLPVFMKNSLPTTTAVALIALFCLYLLAFQSAWIIRISRIFAAWLPPKWAERVMGWLIAGLEGAGRPAPSSPNAGRHWPSRCYRHSLRR